MDTSVGFARPAESNAVEGEKRCRVVCVASCNDLLDARLIERPGHQGGSREREAPRALAHNDWIHAAAEGTTLKIRFGEHAKKARAANGDADAKA